MRMPMVLDAQTEDNKQISVGVQVKISNLESRISKQAEAGYVVGRIDINLRARKSRLTTWYLAGTPVLLFGWS